jgi:Ca2+-binding RTX toxin-like protein
MRRGMMLLAAIAVMVALFAVAAYAATIVGTERSDFLFESQRNDTIEGHAGNDDITAERYPYDADVLQGHSGRDFLRARDGDTRDTLNGGSGLDKCVGEPLDDYIDCELRPQ